MTENVWITINDISRQTPISPNTNIDVLRSYILDAENFDFCGFNEKLFEDIDSALNPKPLVWSPTKTYVVGDRVFFGGKFFKAKATTTNPTTNTTDWVSIELLNFYIDFVKNYIIQTTYARYLPFLGLHATQFGLEQYNQEGFGQVSDKRRGEMVNDVLAKKNIFQTKMENRLKELGYKLDGVLYNQNHCHRNTGNKMNFSIIGANSNYANNRKGRR